MEPMESGRWKAQSGRGKTIPLTRTKTLQLAYRGTQLTSVLLLSCFQNMEIGGMNESKSSGRGLMKMDSQANGRIRRDDSELPPRRKYD